MTSAPAEFHVLQPMGFDGAGPSQTCLNICEAAGRQGSRVRLYGTRRARAVQPRHCTLVTPYGNALARLPYRYSVPVLTRAIERRILRDVPDGATVYVWPALRAEIAEALHARGCRIAVELINILTLREKEILEAEMAAEDFHYGHYVTDAKIDNQKRLLDLADLIFVSNEKAAASLDGFVDERVQVVQTRYGTATRAPRAAYGGPDLRPVFLFVGRINLEKGVHHLLRAWAAAGIDGELHLYGHLDPRFARRYADLLAAPGVRVMGFTRDIQARYAAADGFLFLSLAEGGPQVTVEAAGHGLPLLVGPMGTADLARHDETALVIDPHDTDAVADAIRQVAVDPALRARLGRAAYDASADFTWDVAARERMQALKALAAR